MDLILPQQHLLGRNPKLLDDGKRDRNCESWTVLELDERLEFIRRQIEGAVGEGEMAVYFVELGETVEQVLVVAGRSERRLLLVSSTVGHDGGNGPRQSAPAEIFWKDDRRPLKMKRLNPRIRC